MTREFIPYEQALQLKEIGFNPDELDIEIYGVYDSKGVIETALSYDFGSGLPAPLYQQVYRWFRDKHRLFHEIHPKLSYPDNFISGIEFHIEVWDSSGVDHADYDDNVYSYEEAELACLMKLIEIAQQRK